MRCEFFGIVQVLSSFGEFHSNDGQCWMWAEVGKQPIRPKGQGRGIMVRDFIDEHNGFLQLTDNEFKQA